MVTLPQPIEFEWDSGNEEKNVLRHEVTNEECEQVALNPASFVYDDINHSSKTEARYIIIGFTTHGRLLFIAFTLRKNRVRVISARIADKKERKLYEEATQGAKV